MNLWIDIDKPEYFPLYKELTLQFLRKRINVVLTSVNNKELKELGSASNIKIKHIGYIFSFFNFLEEKSLLIRTSLLCDFLKSQNINFAFSLGNKNTLYGASYFNIPLIYYMENLDEKLDPIYRTLKNTKIILPNTIHKQLLIEKGFELENISNYDGYIRKDDLNPPTSEVLKLSGQIINVFNQVSGRVEA